MSVSKEANSFEAVGVDLKHSVNGSRQTVPNLWCRLQKQKRTDPLTASYRCHGPLPNRPTSTISYSIDDSAQRSPPSVCIISEHPLPPHLHHQPRPSSVLVVGCQKGGRSLGAWVIVFSAVWLYVIHRVLSFLICKMKIVVTPQDNSSNLFLIGCCVSSAWIILPLDLIRAVILSFRSQISSPQRLPMLTCLLSVSSSKT